MGSNIILTAAGTGGTESALASIDVPMNGTLDGVEWSVRDTLNADGEQAQWQVSFGSSISNSNDTRQVISNCQQMMGLTTSGAPPTAYNYYSEQNLPVSAGERIFLHRTATAGAIGTCFCCLHFSFNTPGARR